MKKHAPKIPEPVKETLPQVMEKYGGYFSIELKSGFAHMKFENGEMIVTWLNDEGYVEEEGHQVPFKDIEIIANFMREMKELKLPDYQK